MKTYTKDELNEILKLHRLWLENDITGVRANLRSANLRFADLSSANLRSANLDNKYIQIACIGSRKDMTTYNFTQDIIWCGCFKGTLKEFEAKVNKTHKEDLINLTEYLGFIKYIKSLKKLYK